MSNNPHLKPSPSYFPATRWSLVQRVAGESRDDSRDDLGCWYEHYRWPMVRYLMGKGFAKDTAEDHVQSFMQNQLERDRAVFRLADPKRPFRNYLCSCLLNFVDDTLRREHAQRRHPHRAAPTAHGADPNVTASDLSETPGPRVERANFESIDHHEPSLRAREIIESLEAFERDWAIGVLAKALRRFKLAGDASRVRGWRLIERRILLPLLMGAPEPEFSTLADDLGYDDAKQARNALTNAFRTIRGQIRTLIEGEVRAHGTTHDAPENLTEASIQAEVEREYGRVHQLVVHGLDRRVVHDRRAPAAHAETPTALPTGAAADEQRAVLAEMFLELLDEPLCPTDRGASETTTANLEVLEQMLADTAPTIPKRSRAELQASLKWFLNQPVNVDLCNFDDAASVRASADACNLLLKSYGDVLHHAHPPLELLVAIKDFFKSRWLGHDTQVPPEVNQVLYYTAAVAALLRRGERITQLSDRELSKGVVWAMEQPWIDAPTRVLLTQGLETLTGDLSASSMES